MHTTVRSLLTVNTDISDATELKKVIVLVSHHVHVGCSQSETGNIYLLISCTHKTKFDCESEEDETFTTVRKQPKVSSQQKCQNLFQIINFS